ncbi:MAG: DUF2147 domain-containing protein [Cetobacterium sp.]|uniref:DUF2147 domain-containing protein n=1 Tax=Cetobacterium sp. TaxID=2071632 RepID=UPI003F3CC1C7
MLKLLISIFLILGCRTFSVENSYEGDWIMPDKKVVIEIEKENSQYKGYVHWLKDLTYPKGDKMEGLKQIDRNNPELSLRHRKILGLQVVGNLKLSSDKNKLVGGWIYDSWNGKKYYGSAQLIDENTLKLRGAFDKYGILGYSMIVKRVASQDYK